MILHTVNHSPFQQDTLATCLRFAATDDAILLIEDGVYGAIEGGALESVVTTPDGPRVFVLAADVAARGIAESLLAGIESVDYDGFVALTEQHERVVSWF